MVSLDKCVAFHPDFSVNLEQTLANVQLACESYNATRGSDLTVIAEAVHAVFEHYKGANIGMKALQGYVLARIPTTPATYTLLAQRVEQFVKSQLGTVFSQEKGPKGGVRRLSDLQPATPTTANQ